MPIILIKQNYTQIYNTYVILAKILTNDYWS